MESTRENEATEKIQSLKWDCLRMPAVRLLSEAVGRLIGPSWPDLEAPAQAQHKRCIFCYGNASSLPERGPNC